MLLQKGRSQLMVAVILGELVTAHLPEGVGSPLVEEDGLAWAKHGFTVPDTEKKGTGKAGE